MNIELLPIATLVIKTFEFNIETPVNTYCGRVEVRQMDDDTPPRLFCEIDTPNTYTDAELAALEIIIKNKIING